MVLQSASIYRNNGQNINYEISKNRSLFWDKTFQAQKTNRASLSRTWLLSGENENYTFNNTPRSLLMIALFLFCSFWLLSGENNCEPRSLLVIALFCFVPTLSSCHDKATVALCFRRIRSPHLFRSCPFPSFPVVSSTSYHWICCLFEVTKQR